MRQAKNDVYVQGYFAENGLTQGVDSNGNNVIKGNVTVRVPMTLPNGEIFTSDIPFSVYVSQLTKAGKENPAYKGLATIMKEAVSLSACGNIENATKLSIKTNIEESFFYVENKGEVISFPRLRATFINIVTKDFEPKATWETEFIMGTMVDVTDKDGNPVSPRKARITAFIPGYGDRLDQVVFTADNANVINALEQYWQTGESYKAHGYLRFAVETVEKVEESGFGDGITKKYTNRTKELIITGGSDQPLPEGLAWEIAEIKEGRVARQERMEAEKNRAKKTTNFTQTPTTAPKSNADKAAALGF